MHCSVAGANDEWLMVGVVAGAGVDAFGYRKLANYFAILKKEIKLT